MLPHPLALFCLHAHKRLQILKCTQLIQEQLQKKNNEKNRQHVGATVEVVAESYSCVLAPVSPARSECRRAFSPLCVVNAAPSLRPSRSGKEQEARVPAAPGFPP